LKPPIWVNREPAFRQMVEKLASFPSLSVDTESNSLHAYQEQVCLIQFSTADADYLVDPLALRDLSLLGPILANPQVEKIFHAAEYDLICLRRDFGFEFSNIFDTMVAARILGRPAVGLGSLLETEFGIQVNKRFQRADWAQRPLPPEHLAYARQDTHYLLGLRNRLRGELEANGRLPLAEEDFRRMAQFYSSEPIDEPETVASFWRISGAQDLTPQQAAVLQALVSYRDQRAKAANLPPFKILSNQSLLAVAQSGPRTPADLKNLGVLTPRQLQRFGDGLLQAVDKGLRAVPVRRPSGKRPDDRFLNRLEALRNWRKQAAQAMGVESDVVLPRDLLYALAERNPREESDVREVLQLTPWRLERFGAEITRVLSRLKS